jgi:hypothetical protein
MSPIRLHAGLAAGLVLSLAASSPLLAQEKVKPAAQDQKSELHRMEILNGPHRSVHYFSRGFSPGETATLTDLERAENEVSLNNGLLGLRQQYITNERAMESRRHHVQNLLYGANVNLNRADASTQGFGFGGGAFGGYPLYGFRFGGYGPSFNTSSYGASSTNYSLANGMGDEGVIKNEIARSLGGMVSPGHAVQASQEYRLALSNAARSEGLARELKLGKGEATPATYSPPGSLFGLSPGDKVTITTKGGEKIEGKLASDSPDWVVIDTPTEELTLRKSEITRVSKAK